MKYSNLIKIALWSLPHRLERRFLEVTISLLIFYSCSFFDFSQPVIQSVSPGDQSSLNDPGSFNCVEINFSKAMNQGTVQNAFILKQISEENLQETAVPGYFEWDSGSSDLKYCPQNPISYGKYRIVILNGAKDTLGNDIRHGTNTIFNIGSSFTPPAIIYTYPVNGAANLPSTNLIITVGFSKPINTSQMSTMFSISPPLSYKIQALSNNSFFELLPLSAYPQGQYTLSFNTNSIVDLYGNALRPANNIFFTIGKNFNPPQLIGIYTDSNCMSPPLLLTNGINDIDKFSVLYFSFNESLSVNFNNIPVSFSPSIQGTWQTNGNGRKLIFSPSGSWNIGSPYTVTINPGIMDIFGNTSQNTYQAYLFILSPTSYFIGITNIVPLSSSWTAAANWTPTVINVLSNTNTLQVYLYFNSSLQPYTVLGNISISVFNSPINNYVYISEIKFLTQYAPNDTICVTIMSNTYNIYNLSIKSGTGGIRDIYQNILSNDINIYYQME